MKTTIKSRNQQGGITAGSVAITDQSNIPKINSQRKKNKFWTIAGVVIGLLGLIIAYLTYIKSSTMDKINVTSYNQQGGITAHTVNVGRTPRQLNNDVITGLKQHIPKTARVEVHAVLGDAEAFKYATDILNWMKSNGYSNTDGVNQSVWTTPVAPQGINKISDSHFQVIIGSQQ